MKQYKQCSAEDHPGLSEGPGLLHVSLYTDRP